MKVKKFSIGLVLQCIFFCLQGMDHKQVLKIKDCSDSIVPAMQVIEKMSSAGCPKEVEYIILDNYLQSMKHEMLLWQKIYPSFNVFNILCCSKEQKKGLLNYAKWSNHSDRTKFRVATEGDKKSFESIPESLSTRLHPLVFTKCKPSIITDETQELLLDAVRGGFKGGLGGLLFCLGGWKMALDTVGMPFVAPSVKSMLVPVLTGVGVGIVHELIDSIGKLPVEKQQQSSEEYYKVTIPRLKFSLPDKFFNRPKSRLQKLLLCHKVRE